MDTSTVVLDVGSHSVKVGFGNAPAPEVIPAIAGTFKYHPLFHGLMSNATASSSPTAVPQPSSVVVGRDVAASRGLLRLSYPVQHGTVVDWSVMTTLLQQSERALYHQQAYSTTTASATELPPVSSSSAQLTAVGMSSPSSSSSATTVYALIESPFASRVQRRRLVEALLEGGGVGTGLGGAPGAGVFCGVAPLLSLYSTGETTGVVLDVGEGVVCTGAAVNGFALTSTMQREDGGATGGDVTTYLQTLMKVYGTTSETSAPGAAFAPARRPLLSSYGSTGGGHSGGVSAEREVVREIKEHCCTVSPTPLPAVGAMRALTQPSSSATGTRPLDAALVDFARSAALAPEAQPYRLPDGTELAVGQEAVEAPEVLFSPALVGSEGRSVVDMVLTTVAAAEMEVRPALLQNVLVTGGTSLIGGFGARMLSELLQRTPRDNRVRVVAPAERGYAAWLGCAFLSQLSTFSSQLVVTRAEYAEHGESILQARLFA